MPTETQTIARREPAPDYSLIGVNAALAVERGRAEADWYQ